MSKYFRKVLTREEGQGLVEYALILVLVAMIVIVILLQLGPQIGEVFSRITDVIGGGSGNITSVAATSTWDPFGPTASVTVTVSVKQNTNVTISGGLTGGGSCNAPSCQFTFITSSQHGTFTAKDGAAAAGVQGSW